MPPDGVFVCRPAKAQTETTGGPARCYIGPAMPDTDRPTITPVEVRQTPTES